MKVDDLLEKMSPNEQAELFSVLESYKRSQDNDKAVLHFMDYVRLMWPDFVSDSFISGKHHKIMSDKFEDIASGRIKRLIINMPPRHTKSEFGSFLFPSWYMGKFPHRKIIQATHTGDLSLSFGRKVRNLGASPLTSATISVTRCR